MIKKVYVVKYEEDQERNPETGRFKKSPKLSNMPDDILYKILSKLSLKNMITFLYLSKEYEDIRQIIKKKLKRICDKNKKKLII